MVNTIILYISHLLSAGFTLWLFVTWSWKIHPFLIGKPSISMGHSQ